ncbi:MAG: bifunctional pyr operon transcriptional regulator/uracil phosphoribosyltransferase PyrR [Oscillospiraceae bacterium]
MVKNIMDAKDMSRVCVRLAHEIIERNKGTDGLVLIGIQRRGVPLAHRIAALIGEYEGVNLPVGRLDITFYRDDLSLLSDHPILSGTDLPFSVQDQTVIIVDDVLYTGRTARAAIEAIMEAGRPKCIQLLVMIDRGHRELPIRADFVGKNLPTSQNEVVHVCVEQYDGENKVTLDTPDR